MRLSSLISLACVAFVLLLTGCKDTGAQSLPAQPLTIITQEGTAHEFNAEMALTAEQQRIGLMHRKHMKDSRAMLFVFEGSAERNFWMDNTLIPLDLLFITQNGIVHHIHENAKPLDRTRIPSNGPSKAVLEINGGLSKTLGITEGSQIKHEIFSLSKGLQKPKL